MKHRCTEMSGSSAAAQSAGICSNRPRNETPSLRLPSEASCEGEAAKGLSSWDRVASKAQVCEDARER